MPIKQLSFNYTTDIVTKKQFSEHIKLYEGYVTKINQITSELAKNADRANSNAVYSKYRGLKTGETFSLDSVILHELYFQNLGTKSNYPLANTIKILERAFSGKDNFFEDLTACGISARGWVVFAYDQRSGTFRNFLLDAHDKGNILMAFPIIVLDMYEHSYFMDFGTNKNAYIKNFIEGIEWDVVEKRIQRLVGNIGER